MRYPGASKEELRAPQSQFRVVAIDLADTSEICQVGDFEDVYAAETVAAQRAGVGSPVYVYNDVGELVVRFGSWH